MKEIILPLSIVALVVFLMWGTGYLIVSTNERNQEARLACIKAGKSMINNDYLKELS